MYYYCHNFGNDSNLYFPAKLKRGINPVNMPISLYSTGLNALAFGQVIYDDLAGKKSIDLAGDTQGSS